MVYIVFACTLFAAPSHAVMQDSPHEVSNGNDKTSGFCITCHSVETPSDQTQTPLWSSGVTNQAFIPYDNATGLALDISQKCLSCHDGLDGVDRYGDGIGLSGFTKNTTALRTGLHKSHPVSIPYRIGVAKLKSLYGNNAVKLFNGKIECASCHHPHLTNNEKHLRISNTKSSLCLSCHDK